MESMIDRIAACITGGSTFNADDRIEIAKAILNEMLEPTDMMAEAGRIQCDVLDNGSHKTWRAMIDSALDGA